MSESKQERWWDRFPWWLGMLVPPIIVLVAQPIAQTYIGDAGAGFIRENDDKWLAWAKAVFINDGWLAFVLLLPVVFFYAWRAHTWRMRCPGVRSERLSGRESRVLVKARAALRQRAEEGARLQSRGKLIARIPLEWLSEAGRTVEALFGPTERVRFEESIEGADVDTVEGVYLDSGDIDISAIPGGRGWYLHYAEWLEAAAESLTLGRIRPDALARLRAGAPLLPLDEVQEGTTPEEQLQSEAPEGASSPSSPDRPSS